MKPEFGEHYKALATFKATEDSRKLTLPQAPEAYEITTSKNFQPPQGVEFKVNPDDPMAQHARAWAHKAGLTQDQFSELMDIYAGGQIGNAQMLRTARDAEIAKLGAAGSARVTAVQDFYNAQLGDELGKVMGTMLVTAKHVEAAEKLMAAFRTQGAGSFSSAHRTAPDDTTNRIPGIEKMSFKEARAAQDAWAARQRQH